MSTDLLVHAAGLAALVLNIASLLRRCERRLRVESSLAGVGWALNNLLIGAHTAAALSLISASRTATSALTLKAAARRRRHACLAFMALSLAGGLATWRGWPSALPIAASLLSTHAMFHLRGTALRAVLLLVPLLWMHSAWSNGSWEQIAANLAAAAAAAWGAWRDEAGSRRSLTSDKRIEGSSPRTHAAALD